MTLPRERVWALKNTRTFLLSLIDAKATKRIPSAIRTEAYRCLKHYPWDMHVETLLIDPLERNMEIELLIGQVEQWHQDRNLIDGATDKDQVMKLLQEMGELSDNVCKGKDIRDDLGDMMVVMINIMKRNNITMEECLAVAYDDIKDRKGVMIDGIFVKESDI